MSGLIPVAHCLGAMKAVCWQFSRRILQKAFAKQDCGALAKMKWLRLSVFANMAPTTEINQKNTRLQKQS